MKEAILSRLFTKRTTLGNKDSPKEQHKYEVMDAGSQFKAIPISKENNFSWVFLVDWVLVVVLSLSVVFYFGRALAYCITILMEWVLWRRYKVKINIQSLKISFLGGRVFFKNLTVITKDQTISFLQGSFTWRYWLLNSRKTLLEELEKSGEEKDQKSRMLQCRFFLESDGFELFIYNRTVAYDGILRSVAKDDKESFKKFFEGGEDSLHSSEEKLEDETLASDSSVSNVDSTNDRNFQEQDSRSMLLQFLPIHLKMNRGAVLLGNTTTPSVMIIGYESAEGVVDVCQSNEKLDLYKIRYDLDFNNVDLKIKPNISFGDENPIKSYIVHSRLSRVWKKFKKIFFERMSHYLAHSDNQKIMFVKHQQFFEKWRGLALYSEYNVTTSDHSVGDEEEEEDENMMSDVGNHEYAKYTQILKSTKVAVTYAYDIPGMVPHGALHTMEQRDGPDVGNSGAPPEFSLDFKLYGATICYGPWAHRQIQYLQRMLCPIVSRDAIPLKKLTPGSRRIYTRFNLSVLMMEDALWRIPTRESSKDQDFLKQYRESKNKERPFGWLDIKLTKETDLFMTVGMCPTITGFENKLGFHLVKPEIRSSVNHDIFFKADAQTISADLGYPLGWNSEAQWVFQFNSKQVHTFFLRDHINLLSDIFMDFGSGIPTPYELFRPFVYRFEWSIDNYSIYLNVNDANIINNPLDFNENCYLSLHGDTLKIDFSVDLKTITGNSTTVNYSIRTPKFHLQLDTPSWSTLHEFMKNKEVGRSYDFCMNGSYQFHSDVDVGNMDTILIECQSKYTTLQCYGFVIRYLMNINMNYFGDFIHFKTTEEYTRELQEKLETREAEVIADNVSDESSQMSSTSFVTNDKETTEYDLHEFNEDPKVKRADLKRKENEKDVWFTFCVEDGCLVFPENIYDCTSCIGLHFDSLDVDLRYLNYYMDLQASLSPTYIKRHSDFNPRNIFDVVRACEGLVDGHQGFLSELNIHAHRMFGLPIIEETYFCKWDFQIGSLDIDSDIDFAKGLIGAFSKIGFGYKDYENMLIYEIIKPIDMTSLTLVTDSISFKVTDGNTNCVVALDLDKISASMIDFENERYSNKMSAKIPNIKLLVSEKSSKNEVQGLFETSLDLAYFGQNRDFDNHRNLQRNHITLHDSPYHRCAFLLPMQYQKTVLYNKLFGAITPGVSIPPLTQPVIPNTIDSIFESLLGKHYQDYECCSDANYSKETAITEENSSFIQGSGSTSALKELSSYSQNCPSYKLEPKFEYDSFIINLGKTIIAINPSSEKCLLSIYLQFCVGSIDDIIDANEIDIVEKFSKYFVEKSAVTNLRILAPKICFTFGSPKGKFEVSDYDHLYVEVNHPSLDLCQKKIFGQANSSKLEYTEEVTSSLKASSINFFINQQQLKPKTLLKARPVFSIVFEELEFWSDSSESSKNSLNARAVDFFVNHSQLEWLSDYLRAVILCATKLFASFSKSKTLIQARQKELIFRTALASVEYNIIHDSPVITKPAYITRLSKNHIRENRSWRIITRLRHILNYLPKSWYKRTEESLKKEEFKIPDDARDQFLKIFSNWRSWEFSDVQKCYIYKRVFLSRSMKKNRITGADFKVNLERISFSLSSSTHEDEDFMVVKNLKSVISNELIESSLPPSAKNTEDSASTEKMIISCNIKSIRGDLGDNIVKLVRMYDGLSNLSDTNLKTTSVKHDVKPKLIQGVLLVDRTDTNIHLDGKRLILRSFRNRFSTFMERVPSKSETKVSLAATCASSEAWVRHGSAVLLESSLKDGALNFSQSLFHEHLITKVVLRSGGLSVSAMASTEQYIHFIWSIKASVDGIRKELASAIPKKNNTTISTTKPETSSRLNTVTLDATLSGFSLNIQPLTPFGIHQSTDSIEVHVEKHHQLNADITIRDIDIELLSTRSKQRYLKFSQSTVNLVISNTPEQNAMFLNVGVASGISKLTVSDPREFIYSLVEDETLAIKNFAQLKSLAEKFPSKNQEKSKQRKQTNIIWLLHVNVEYIGIIVLLGSAGYVLELNNVLTSLSNNISARKYLEQGLHGIVGDFSIENVLLLIHANRLKGELSKLVDLAVNLKVSQEEGDDLQNIQIESSHFRVALCPMSLTKVLWAINEFTRVSEAYKTRSSLLQHKKTAPTDISELSNKFRSIQILSYNFCIGWIFDAGSETDPGLIWGYERLFAAYQKPYGKLTLLDAYFSIAHGASSDTFFSNGKEKDQFNRSYLPSMQIGYWFVKEGDTSNLFVRITGERLDVNFLSSSIGIANGAVKSIQTFQELKKTMVDPFATNKTTEKPVNSEAAPLDPILSKIRAFNCIVKYAGGVFKLFSEEDIQNNSKPSFEVESPSVEVAIDYKHLPDVIKSHWIRGLVTVDPSNNTLFPTCVPILSGMTKDVRNMLKSFNSKPKPDRNSTISSSGMNYKKLLRAFDIAFLVNIGKQEISLSCEPKAKVQADVGFEKLAVKMFTNNLDNSEPLSLSIDIEHLRATSRHIFSREVSTSFQIDHIDAVFVLTHPEIIQTYGTTLVSDVQIYFNMKQLQDLNLFLDIWKPDSQILEMPKGGNTRTRSLSSHDKLPVSKFQKPAGTNAFPWNYTLIFSNIKGDIDLGPSLGVLSVRNNRSWAISDHFVDWRQRLSVFLENILLSSDGRLGGFLGIERVCWSSEISWPVKGGFYETPLISLSLELGSLALKTSFDYHMFLIANVEHLLLKLYNERDEMGILKDLLAVSVTCGKIHLFLTALASANAIDIYNTIIRMRQDNKNSYIETLKDSNTQSTKSKRQNQNVLESLSLLRTDLSVGIDLFYLQVFPSTLFDMEVLVLKAEDMSAHTQTQGDHKVKTRLNWQLHNFKVSLSAFKNQFNEEIVSQIEVKEYIKHATKVRGGTILAAPAILVDMTTWQEVSSNVIELLYTSSFGGKVDVKWNLGPINFIREMWATHVRALALRRVHDMRDKNKSFFEDEHIEEKIKDVDLGNKYVYIPLEEPRIEMPQIKDLGDATPPVEWFGVNRQRFPGLTHQSVVVPLQKLAHMAEEEYARVLGNV